MSNKIMSAINAFRKWTRGVCSAILGKQIYLYGVKRDKGFISF